MTDLQGAWVTTTFILVVSSVLDIVLQQFALHSAMAKKQMHAPDIAGISLLALWAPTTMAWLGAGIAIGMLHRIAACNSADHSALWLGLLYPITAWPPVFLGAKIGAPLPRWYWITQMSVAAVILLFGGLPCLI